jgi:hypothetical protein
LLSGFSSIVQDLPRRSRFPEPAREKTADGRAAPRSHVRTGGKKILGSPIGADMESLWGAAGEDGSRKSGFLEAGFGFLANRLRVSLRKTGEIEEKT